MRSFPLVLLPFVGLLLTGCPGGDKPDDTADTSDTSDSGDTSDTSDSGDTASEDGFCGVQALFNDQCVMCHSASGVAGGLDLETDPYAAIVGMASANYGGRTLVVAGDPDGSFLYVKMMNGQEATEGDVMPTGGQLPASDTEIVRAWIAKGATAECDNPDTGEPATHHPEGFDDPSQHGMAAKYQDERCVTCHGADLTGGTSAVSCDSCHEEGWRTDCTWCHGGTDNGTGAPPVDLDNSTSGLSFPEHTAHVTQTIHAAWTCDQCHTTPVDVLSPGHVFQEDFTPAIAELVFAAGQSAAGTYDGAGSCANLYCHGNGRSGDLGSVSSGDSRTCHMCHGDASSSGGMSGEHAEHLREGITCGECHSEIASGNSTIINPDRHVDTTVDVLLPDGMTRSGSTCSGSCHGERHESRRW